MLPITRLPGISCVSCGGLAGGPAGGPVRERGSERPRERIVGDGYDTRAARRAGSDADFTNATAVRSFHERAPQLQHDSALCGWPVAPELLVIAEALVLWNPPPWVRRIVRRGYDTLNRFVRHKDDLLAVEAAIPIAVGVDPPDVWRPRTLRPILASVDNRAMKRGNLPDHLRESTKATGAELDAAVAGSRSKKTGAVAQGARRGVQARRSERVRILLPIFIPIGERQQVYRAVFPVQETCDPPSGVGPTLPGSTVRHEILGVHPYGVRPEPRCDRYHSRLNAAPDGEEIFETVRDPSDGWWLVGRRRGRPGSTGRGITQRAARLWDVGRYRLGSKRRDGGTLPAGPGSARPGKSDARGRVSPVTRRPAWRRFTIRRRNPTNTSQNAIPASVQKTRVSVSFIRIARLERVDPLGFWGERRKSQPYQHLGD